MKIKKDVFCKYFFSIPKNCTTLIRNVRHLNRGFEGFYNQRVLVLSMERLTNPMIKRWPNYFSGMGPDMNHSTISEILPIFPIPSIFSGKQNPRFFNVLRKCKPLPFKRVVLTMTSIKIRDGSQKLLEWFANIPIGKYQKLLAKQETFFF